MSSITIFPYDTPSNYTFDSDKVEVSGGEASLLDQIAAHPATFYADFASSIDGLWGDGVLTGTATGGASVSGGKLDLSFSDTRFMTYAALDNADFGSVGTVRFKYTPNYTGAPAATQAWFTIGNSSNFIDHLSLIHKTNTTIAIDFRGTGASVIEFSDYGGWSPTSGVEYEIELNVDAVTGAHRLFIDGVQHGPTRTSTGTSGGTGDNLRIGANKGGGGTTNFKIDDFIVFDTVQHTSDYTPGTSIPIVPYAQDDPTILTNSSISASELTDFSETVTELGSDDIGYTINIGGTDYYWNGAAVVVSDCSLVQSNTATEISDNAGEFLSVRSTVKIKAILHSDDGTTTPDLDQITVTYNTALPNPLLNTIGELVGFIYDQLGIPIVGQEIKARPYFQGRVAGDVFDKYSYRLVATTDTEGYFAGDLMLLNSGDQMELKIGSQSYRTTIPDQAITDLKDLTLIVVDDE